MHCTEDASRRVDGAKVLRMSVSKRGGRWQASLTVERADLPIPSPPKGGSVGIDLGVKELATLSDGTVMHNPHALKSNLRRLKKAQNGNLSRKRKGSNRRRKARAQVARLSTRGWRSLTLATLLDKTHHHGSPGAYADISIEDLNVAGMVGRPSGSPKAIEDAAFAGAASPTGATRPRGTGARLHVVDRWYPSSQDVLDAAGRVKAKLSLVRARLPGADTCGLDHGP